MKRGERSTQHEQEVGAEDMYITRKGIKLVVNLILQCTMYLTLYSFSLKLCSATIDLKHSAMVAH